MTSPPPQTAPSAARSRSALVAVLVMVSVVAAALAIHQWTTGAHATGFGGNIQHGDPGSVSAPAAIAVSSLPPADARAAGDPGAHHTVQGPETCVDMAARARVCSPSLGIDAAFEPVGVDAAGNMAVPTHDDHAAIGWYSDSAPIGAKQGNAVLAGHVDHPYDAPTLGTLYTAQPGQKLWVSDGSGAVFSYTVTAVREPTPRSAPPQDIFDLTGDPGLSLVTCSGDYVRPDGSPSWSYSNNLIVDLAFDPETASVP